MMPAFLIYKSDSAAVPAACVAARQGTPGHYSLVTVFFFFIRRSCQDTAPPPVVAGLLCNIRAKCGPRNVADSTALLVYSA